MTNQEYWYEEQKQQHFSDANTKKSNKRGISLPVLVVCMLITGLLGGAFGGVISQSAQRNQLAQMQAQIEGIAAQSNLQIEAPAREANALPQASDPASDVIPAVQTPVSTALTKAQIIEYCAPSIVGIDVEVPGIGWYGRQTMQSGSGSGVVLSRDGYIITNNHVISVDNTEATNIKVYLYDDTEYTATLIGRDVKTDLAVIKIDAQNLHPVALGDSASMVVGDDVIAIGNPLGELRGTATSGMVSALSRTLTIEDQDMTLIQTDAAINPGNSGGGLFNMKGELIGVVNAKVASSQIEGLGFAIPIDDAKNVMSDLIDLGYVSGRAYLGVSTTNVQVDAPAGRDGYNYGGLENFFGFFGDQQPYETRVSIVEIMKDGAAEKAGLQVGDYILAVDDTEISTNSQLSATIREYNAGDVANIKILRNDEEMTISVTFGEYVPTTTR